MRDLVQNRAVEVVIDHVILDRIGKTPRDNIMVVLPPVARREERAYRAYASDEQRSQTGCIGGHGPVPSEAERLVR
jgi:hypothetical protein